MHIPDFGPLKGDELGSAALLRVGASQNHLEDNHSDNVCSSKAQAVW